MRTTILFLIILFSFSCTQSKDKTIAFLNEGIEQSNRFIDRQNAMLYTEFAKVNEVNPEFVKKWKNKTDSMQASYDKLKNTIDTLKVQIENNELARNADDKLQQASFDYYQMLKSMLDDSATINKIDKISSSIQNKNLSLNTLNLLENKLLISTHYGLKHLFAKMYVEPFRFNKPYPVVIPTNRYLKVGEYYSAEIHLSALDTIKKPLIIVNNDTLEVINGIAKYTSLKNEHIGVKNIKGRIEYLHPYGKSSLPFTIIYKVVK